MGWDDRELEYVGVWGADDECDGRPWLTSCSPNSAAAYKLFRETCAAFDVEVRRGRIERRHAVCTTTREYDGKVTLGPLSAEQEERDAMLAGPLNHKNRKAGDFPVVITSYEVAMRDEKRLNKIGEYTFLVVDEGQRLKNHRCTLISSLKRIRSSNRLIKPYVSSILKSLMPKLREPNARVASCVAARCCVMLCELRCACRCECWCV